MKVIFNADDFGYTPGVTDGILHGYQNGVIRSTTALVNAEDIERAARLAAQNPGLGVGLHLNLTLGKALTKGKTIAKEDGSFYSRAQRTAQTLDTEEVYEEFAAQLERFIEIFGCLPTHLDSHHGMHDFQNNLSAASRLAQQYNLPMRRYSNYQYVPEFFGSQTPDQLISILKKYQMNAPQNPADTKNHAEGDQEVCLEIMCHPAFNDERLMQLSSLNAARQTELDILTSPEVLQYVKDHGITLCSYQNIAAST